MGGRAKEADAAFDAERAAKWDEFYQEEQAKPLDWIKHDTNASDDDKLQDLRDEHGFEALGRWWLLVEKLAGRKHHRYDVSRPNGWKRLAMDLEFDSVDECRAFVEALLGYGLLTRESFEEFGNVASARIDRNAEVYAQDQANRRIGAWAKARNAELGKR